MHLLVLVVALFIMETTLVTHTYHLTLMCLQKVTHSTFKWTLELTNAHAMNYGTQEHTYWSKSHRNAIILTLCSIHSLLNHHHTFLAYFGHSGIVCSYFEILAAFGEQILIMRLFTIVPVYMNNQHISPA